LQFENLILNNRKKVYRLLGLKFEEVLADNPYFQHKTSRQQGCQIDYLIQSRYQTLFVCEIKFSKNPIDLSIVTEVKKKIAKLKVPKTYSCLPVLIHINGVTEEVMACNYFYKIIDFGELLEN
jgi:uncharacterized protein